LTTSTVQYYNIFSHKPPDKVAGRKAIAGEKVKKNARKTYMILGRRTKKSHHKIGKNQEYTFPTFGPEVYGGRKAFYVFSHGLQFIW
jgi:hypothetical protein